MIKYILPLLLLSCTSQAHTPIPYFHSGQKVKLDLSSTPFINGICPNVGIIKKYHVWFHGKLSDNTIVYRVYFLNPKKECVDRGVIVEEEELLRNNK